MEVVDSLHGFVINGEKETLLVSTTICEHGTQWHAARTARSRACTALG